MVILEALLLSILIYTCAYVTITDIKNGLIENRVLAYSAIIGAIINIIYYAIYASDLAMLFVINLVISSFVAVLFYTYHIWAAGDSKFLALSVFLIPMRLYDMNGYAPAIWIIILIFSAAYIYIIIESVYLSIKDKKLIQLNNVKFNAFAFMRQYIICSAYILIFNWICNFFFDAFIYDNTLLVAFADLIIILSVCSISIFKRKWIIGIVILFDIILYSINHFGIVGLDVRVLMLTGIVIVLRMIADKYNYREIDTSTVKKGMVLSYATIITFSKSKVVGLPNTTTEDLRSRISESEAQSILRWKDSKYGNETITIVRKIPFAIFISIGTIVFIILRVCM